MPNNNEVTGVQIGNQRIAANAPIQRKTPSDFLFPTNEDPRRDNILFNTDPGGGWIIFDPSGLEDNHLHENTNYGFGEDISVKATWWKKVEANIWCADGSAQNALKPNVHVLNGHGAGPAPYNLYSFFSDGDTSEFSITGATDRKITVGQEVYTFVGWTETEPLIFSLSATPLTWCTTNLYHTHGNTSFNNLCKHDEYAVFIHGANIEIIVTTNDDGTKNWNNNTDKIGYKLTWESDDTYWQAPFNSIPPIPTNPPRTVPSTHFGDGFVLETSNPNGEPLHYLGEYELKGWYLGAYNGGFDPDAFAAIENSEQFFAGDTSALINAITSPIVVTAIYMPSDNQYTITYYSGLPEL